MTLTLQELSDRSGITIRTIRSWIQKGVLPSPTASGRNTRYPEDTLTRLLAAKALNKRHRTPIQDIPSELRHADAATVAKLAAEGAGNRNVEGTVARARQIERQVSAERQQLTKGGVGKSHLASVVAQLEHLTGKRSVPRKARGEPRLIINITPDIELSIREPRGAGMTPIDMANYERIADLLRELLS